MTLLRATVTGNLTAAMDGEVKRVAAGLRRAVAATGKQVQTELRAQARGAGFKDGGRAIANTWRLAVYPRPGVGPKTLRPAAHVTSRMPDVVTAFDKGATITASGRNYLAWPTGYNAGGGRRSAGRRAGLRVTPDQMAQAGKRGEAFVLHSKTNPGIRLWCLRVAAATGTTKRSRNRLRLIVGSATEVATASRKGAAARRRELLAQGFVPMFFLAPSVRLRKRLDIAAIRRRAPAIFAALATAELAR